MYWIFIPFDSAQLMKSPLKNSGPLSQRIISGRPLLSLSLSNTRINLFPVIDVSISMANTSLLKSSITLNVLNRFPSYNESLMKSADQICPGFILPESSIYNLLTFRGSLRLQFSMLIIIWSS